MDILNVKQKLEEVVNRIFRETRTYYGNSMPDSVRKLVRIEGDERQGQIIVPRWFPTFQHGRGKYAGGKSDYEMWGGVKVYAFARALYFWMEKRGMFESKTEKGKINEAKGLAWYINQHGSKQKRDGVYIDIYDTIIKDAKKELLRDFKAYALKITSELVRL